MGQFGKKPRPEIAECFFGIDGDGKSITIKCGRCSKNAVVRDGNVYYCARDWEYKDAT